MSLISVGRRNLCEARRKAGLTQLELAKKLGTTQTNVSRWERSVVAPSEYYKRKLTTFFHQSTADLGLDEDRGVPAHKEYGDSAPLVYQHLVGREQELHFLRQSLSRRQGLIAVTGLPGIGKTALIAALVRDPYIRDLFSDGILWAPLGIRPNKSIFRRWGKMLGIAEEEQAHLLSAEEWGVALRTAIGSRRMLIVLDDAWEERTARAYQVGGPNCAHIVTTRHPAVASSITDAVLLVPELGKEHSFQLLRNLAPEIIDSEQEQARKLIATVGGLPLALKLMGNYLRKEGRNRQSRRIQVAFARLRQAEVRLHLAQGTSPDEPHQVGEEATAVSLYALLDVSARHLSQQARQDFYALAVLPEKPATFSEVTASNVASCESDILDELADAGLVEVSGERYALHQVVADYARLNFKQQPQEVTNQVYWRLVECTLAYARTYERDFELLDRECYLYRAALEAADAQGYHQEFLNLVAVLAPYISACLIYGVEFYMVRAIELAQTMERDKAYPCLVKIVEERIRLRQAAGDETTARSLAQTGMRAAEVAGDAKALARFADLLNDKEQELPSQPAPDEWCGVPQTIQPPTT